MPLTLIKGKITPQFGRPDGDSVRFVPTNPDLIFTLRRRGRPPKINQNNGSIQLRYEGIDTMESSALIPFSSNATKANLDFCGTNNGANESAGYVLTNQLGPNGRPICFIFSGDINQEDGSQVFLDTEQLKHSVNYQMIAAGHAYPLFYDTLFSDLRDKFSAAIVAARIDGGDMWAADTTNTGTRWPDGDDPVKNITPIFPKLWRRIQKYSKDEDYFDEAHPFRNLKKYIELEASERVLILSKGKITGFDNVISTTDDTVTLDVAPEDLVVVSK